MHTLTEYCSALAQLLERKGQRRLARLLLDDFAEVTLALLPPGGTTGQVLEKDSNANYDASWHTVTIPPSPAKGLVFGKSKSSGLSTGQLAGYVTVDYAGTISGWTLNQIGGTAVTVKFWKIATGTALPTAANSINTSGVSLTGAHVRSTVVSDFTTVAVTLGDIFAVEVTSITGTITDFSGTLEITPT